MSPNWWWNLTRAMKKAGWKFKASSDGSTKVTTSNPAADQWGSGTTSNAGASAASITAIANGRATVTGLTGIVAADKGRFLLISGASSAANNNQHQIEEVLSSTSVRIDARNFTVVAPDASNGALTWSVRDPLGNLYGLTANAWWCAQGPSVLRIPITAVSVGSFTRGENITQSTTGAQGELLGYHFNSGLTFLVVSPRLRGSGTGVHGWQTGFTVTGGTSAATVVQNGTAIDYVYEMVLWKVNSSFQLFIGQFDSVVENVAGGMFSACAAQAGCTATVPPGASGTGNTFSASAWVMWAAGTTTGFEINLPGTGTLHHRGHVICADAIPEQGYSADGSWSLLYGINATNPTAGLCMFGFHKVEDTINEELSPYVTINPGGIKTLYGENRTSAGTVPTVTSSDTTFVDGASVYFGGWRRKALGAPENFAELRAAYDLSLSQHVIDLRARVLSGPDTGLRIRYPIVVMGAFMIKGTLKWVNWFDYDGRIPAVYKYSSDPAWVQISARVIVGPAAEEPWLLSF